MLGRGRPFILEFINPKKSQSCYSRIAEVEQLVNEATELVKCREYRIVGKSVFEELKQTIETKAKAYSSLVWVQKEITPEDCERLSKQENLEISQKTPVRVLHRRSQLVRTKYVHRLKAEWINKHYMKLHVLASAGTYIKEFVHGDLGRTVPSIGQLLGCEADIL